MQIKISRNNKYKITLEKVEEFENSFFSDIYRKALDILIEICDSSKKPSNDSKKLDEESKIISNEKERDNNVIAFIGERGSGKSSSMISFVNALENQRTRLLEFGRKPKEQFNNGDFELINQRKKSLEFEEKKQERFNTIKFQLIDVIDPSFFEKHDNILEIVIAKMFQKFKNALSENCTSLNKEKKYSAKKELLEKFENVYKSIKLIHKNDKCLSDDEIIEVISNLSVGSNLRKDIEELIREYLNFFCEEDPCEKGQKFLVLVIDDFDLNIRHAAEMAELIRKYLFLPNVIIFTALNHKDLFVLIQQDYSKFLDIALKNNQTNNVEVKEKAFRYLEKFIPYPRRIPMPNIQKDRKLIDLILDFEDEKKILKIMFENLLDKVLLPFSFQNTSISRKDEIIVLKKELIEKVNNHLDSYDDKNYELNLFKKFVSTFIDEFFDKLLNKRTTFTNGTPNFIRDYILNELNNRLENKVLKLLGTRININFLPTNTDFDTLIPDSLRELRSFIFMLLDLESTNKQINLSEFQKYFNENWIKKYLSHEEESFVNLVEAVNLEIRNKTIINSILKIFGKKKSKKQNASLIQVLNILYNLPENINEIRSIFPFKVQYSIRLSNLLNEKNYTDINNLIGRGAYEKEDYINKSIELKPRKFDFSPSKAYKRLKFLFNFFKEINNTKDLIITEINENKTKIISSFIEISKKGLFKTLEFNLKKNQINKNDAINKVLEIFRKISNNGFNQDNIDSLETILIINFLNNPNFGILIANLNYLNKINSFSESTFEIDDPAFNKLKKIISDINKDENYDWAEKILNLIENFNFEKQIKNILNSNSYFLNELKKDNKEKDIYFESIEWLHIFFSYFTNNNYLDIFGDIGLLYSNSFGKFERNFINLTDNFQNKEIYLSEVPFIEFEFYDSLQMKKNNLKHPYNDTNWKVNNLSINKKFDEWFLLGFNSALPINNLFILEKILLNPQNIRYYFEEGVEKFANSVIGIFFLINNNLIDFPILQNIFHEHPLIKPLIDDDGKSELFRELFKFVFNDSAKEIKEDNNEKLK